MGEYQDDYKTNRGNNLGINIHEYPLKNSFNLFVFTNSFHDKILEGNQQHKLTQVIPALIQTSGNDYNKLL